MVVWLKAVINCSSRTLLLKSLPFVRFSPTSDAVIQAALAAYTRTIPTDGWLKPRQRNVHDLVVVGSERRWKAVEFRRNLIRSSFSLVRRECERPSPIVGKTVLGRKFIYLFFSSLSHHSYSNAGLGGRIKPLIREAVTKQKKRQMRA